jgi:uncharacterized repeat protein (TIGR01451 family)
MTLTREWRSGIALTLAILLGLTAFVWGNQRHAHAQATTTPTLAQEIICYVDQQLGPNIPFDPQVDYCNSNTQNPTPPTPTSPTLAEQIICYVDQQLGPNIPFDPQIDYCNTPPPTDVCPNIDGVQTTVPDGKILQDGNCVDNPGGGGGGVASGSDLSMTKTVSSASPNVGDTLTYTLTVHNAGPDNATGVSVTDLLPAGVAYVSDDSASSSTSYATSTGLWTIGSLANGASDTLNIVVTVNAAAGQQVTNSATATSSQADANMGDNSGSASFTVPGGSSGGGGGGSGGGGGGGGSHGRGSGGGGGSSGGEVLGAADCAEYLTSYIRAGAQNDPEQVTRLQFVLKQFEGANISLTGVYDAATQAAVDTFQAKYGSDVLTPWALKGPTGYVYYTTRKKINEVFCQGTKVFPLSVAQLQEIAQVRPLNESGKGAEYGEYSNSKTQAGATGAAKGATLSGDQNASTTSKSQTAGAGNASGGNWWQNFVHWLFGR